MTVPPTDIQSAEDRSVASAEDCSVASAAHRSIASAEDRSGPGPAARRIRRDHERAEREILDAAERFLAEHDFRDLRVDELMRATGMKRSTFYHYFGDRSAVIIRLLEEIEGEASDAAAAWLEGPEADPVQAVRSAIAGVADVWHRHRHVLRAVRAGSFHDARIEHQYRAVLLEGFIGASATRLRRERRAGRTPVSDPDDTARALCLMNEAVFAERLGRDPAESPSAVSATLTRIWVAAIYPDAAAPAAEVRPA